MVASPRQALDPEVGMTGFVQVIEWQTHRIDEVRALNEQWRERFPQQGPRRIVTAADRDHPNSYMTLVEFASYEEAMKNSNDPTTSEFAARMAELCDAPPTFHNLDIERTEERG
jgi:hypothetical protein